MGPSPDVVVVGAGIVGLASGLSLSEMGARVTLVDKEAVIASHQTGHNSGVLHTGIYYRPGSDKARFCVDGRQRMLDFCREEQIRTDIGGKVVVATGPDELGRLDELLSRARANGVVGVRSISPSELKALEPEARGIAALHVPGAGTVDYKEVAVALRRRIEALGGEVVTGSKVVGATRKGTTWSLDMEGHEQLQAPKIVVCAGLQADRVASLLGLRPGVRIVPFRGEYWHLLRPELVRSLIYPVPDPRFPFLGVHFTKRIDGTIEVGPNAVLAFAREGYSWGRIVPSELVQILSTPGLMRLARRYWRTGSTEIARSLVPALLLRAVRALVPAVRSNDLVRAGAGVRAQALTADGQLVDDFAFASGDGVLAVLNAPSPAATASLAIGQEIAARLADS
ncbi:MAG TPA: L-2-hydroxyglutarate oxidase [Acidimicrobiia bacterium]|nr:L-2-hydroxyglutarate oxidase [Acidimicrobiia bacterium]